MTFLSLQETKTLFESEKYKSLLEDYKVMRDHGFYDHDTANLFGTGDEQQEHKVDGLDETDKNKVMETLKTVPLSRLVKEFLAKSSTTGLDGAAYLIPLKIYQTLYTYAASADIINDVSSIVVPASEVPGATLDVDIAKYGTYKPHKFQSGGKQVEEEIAFTKSTLDFTAPWGINFSIGNDLIEDQKFSLIDVHVRMAGEQMGKYSSYQVLNRMITNSGGDGTMYLAPSMGADNPTLTNYAAAYDQPMINEFRPTHHLTTYHGMLQVMKDTTYFPSGTLSTWRDKIFAAEDPKMLGLEWIRCDLPPSNGSTGADGMYEIDSAGTGATMGDLKAWVFAKDYFLISGRKRWLRMENYSDPVRDLVGATITARQDTQSLYNTAASYLLAT
jgi:hypothetical protein